MHKVHPRRVILEAGVVVVKRALSLAVARVCGEPRQAVRNLLIAGAVSVLTAAGAWGASPIPAVDNVFSDLDRTNSPGCALGVTRDGEFLYRRGYGMASLEHNVPITSETLFYAGSVSKEFVAASIALAAEQGRLGLDDDVHKHIPELSDYGHKITLQNLIHHSSGIRDDLVLLQLAGKPAEDVLDKDEILALIVRQKALNFEPGSQYLYSNSGYFLLAEILHRATGMTLREFAEKNIFHPLGMTTSRFHDNRLEIVPKRAFAYSPAQDGGFELNWSSNFDQVGSGGLLTSVNDMLGWERNFLKPRIGSPKFLETIQTPGEQPVSGNDPDARYAFGLILSHYRGLKTVIHAGAMFGFRAAFLRFPEERFAVICLCNVSDADPMDRAFRVADFFLADRLGPPYSEQHPPQTTEGKRPAAAGAASAASLARFAGTYHSEELDASYRFLVQDGRLVFAGNKTLPAAPLEPAGQDRFRASPGGMSLEFTFSDDSVVLDAGRVTGIRFDRLNGTNDREAGEQR
jgi:CubicO group peptidase (beta-lactamase class C family)